MNKTSKKRSVQVSGSDPLVVEDWSAYEKSMLEVLREERRARLNIVTVEPPMSPEALRQFVQGKTVEPGLVESSTADAAAQPVCPASPVEQGEPESSLTAMEDQASNGGAVPQAAAVLSLEQQADPVQRSSAMKDEAPGNDAALQSAPVLLVEEQSEPAPEPAAMEAARHDQPAAAISTASTHPVDTASWWRIPLLLSSLAVAVAGTAVAIVKPDRHTDRAPAAPIAQGELVQKDSAAAVNPMPEAPTVPARPKYEVSAGRVRLRAAPAAEAPVTRILHQGASVTIEARSNRDEWCRVQAAGGPKGWMKCEFLKETDSIRQN